ncbi:unnamed protein product [Polarella glacialis]|uniref:Uncharacterized protein n=1 Tax=Polarella glacialis TaxID=89957 RepID=A0A813D4T5_POLGL|nr:unnamed protein product [Polarella glacialis]CAE8667431.1 unnamed protein product [Polarella glacialis]
METDKNVDDDDVHNDNDNNANYKNKNKNKQKKDKNKQQNNFKKNDDENDNDENDKVDDICAKHLRTMSISMHQTFSAAYSVLCVTSPSLSFCVSLRCCTVFCHATLVRETMSATLNKQAA